MGRTSISDWGLSMAWILSPSIQRGMVDRLGWVLTFHTVVLAHLVQGRLLFMGRKHSRSSPEDAWERHGAVASTQVSPVGLSDLVGSHALGGPYALRYALHFMPQGLRTGKKTASLPLWAGCLVPPMLALWVADSQALHLLAILNATVGHQEVADTLVRAAVWWRGQKPGSKQSPRRRSKRAWKVVLFHAPKMTLSGSSPSASCEHPKCTFVMTPHAFNGILASLPTTAFFALHLTGQRIWKDALDCFRPR